MSKNEYPPRGDSETTPDVYFSLNVIPPKSGAPWIISVENFHPGWREASQILQSNHRYRRLLEEFAKNISERAETSATLFWDESLGLRHIRLNELHAPCLTLSPEMRSYCSVNIDTVNQAFTMITIVNEYINGLRRVLSNGLVFSKNS